MMKQGLPLFIVSVFVLLLVGCVPVQPSAAAAITNSGENVLAEEQIASRVMTYQLDDLTLEYEVIGKGQPALILHGWPSERSMMIDSYEPIFSKRTGWQRVYVDLPGMGQTRGGSWINSNDDVLL